MGFLRDVMFFSGIHPGIEWDLFLSWYILVNSKDPGIHPQKEALNISAWWIIKNIQKPKAARRTRFFFDPRVEKIASKIMYLLVS